MTAFFVILTLVSAVSMATPGAPIEARLTAFGFAVVGILGCYLLQRKEKS